MSENPSEMKELAQEASNQAKNIVEQQKGTIAESLAGVARALETTVSQLENERQTGVASYVQEAATSLQHLASDLERKDLASIRRDAEQLARARPALFLGGCVALGFALSRFLKASEERPRASRDAREAREAYASERPSPVRLDDDLGSVGNVGTQHEEGWQP